jgi:hypothetical protein
VDEGNKGSGRTVENAETSVEEGYNDDGGDDSDGDEEEDETHAKEEEYKVSGGEAAGCG